MRQLIVTSPKLLIIMTSLILGSGFMLIEKGAPSTTPQEVRPETDELKMVAFEILKTKCNVCHVKQNPRKVFTLSNMPTLAPKIHKQVFVKKRMPRGKKIKLTPAEYDTLQKWLLSQVFATTKTTH